jgi:NAD(P)-dependent dehydrogenase (short-subunit alcohol dehydrogenase family)
VTPPGNAVSRVAIVLGAGHGIGRATALHLNGKGFVTVLCARRRGALEEVVEESGAEKTAHLVPGDITDPSFCEELAREVDRRYGRIDVLVNNAPGPSPGSFDDVRADDVSAAMRQKLVPYLATVKAVGPVMLRNGFGRIVNIVGNAGREPAPGLFLSGLVNAAVANAGKYLASRYAPHGVTVNTVHPGTIRTGRYDRALHHLSRSADIPRAEAEARLRRTIPMDRPGEAHEVAAVIGFLASDEAAYLTGQQISVDGGQLACL